MTEPNRPAEHLDGVIIEIDTDTLIVSARTGGQDIRLRMVREIFDPELLAQGMPIRMTVAPAEYRHGLLIERRQVERVDSEIARELMAWVESL